MKHWRPLLACASGLLALLLVNLEIVAKERILSNGKRVLLELRPVDPRALIQGDYMRLAFHRRIYPSSQQKKNLRPRGTVIFRLDKNLVAQFD